MSADVRRFKRRIFGGFDTGDVMRYIEELAAQRNRYKLSGDKLQLELQTLNTEIRQLRENLDDADRRISDISLKALGGASGSLDALRQSYGDIRTEMESAAGAISRELTRLSGALTLLSGTLDKTDSRFSELLSELEQDKADAVSARAERFSD